MEDGIEEGTLPLAVLEKDGEELNDFFDSYDLFDEERRRHALLDHDSSEREDCGKGWDKS